MDRVAFSIGSFKIHWYGIMAALGFIAATAILQLNRKHAKMTTEQVSDLMLIVLVSGVLGARLFYVVQFWGQFKNSLLEVVRIDHGGLVFYGGFICAAVCTILYCKRKSLSPWLVMDAIAPALALGHALGRIGCFLNGCCYGKVCQSVHAWTITYPTGSVPAKKYPDMAEPVTRLLENGLVMTAYKSLPLYPVQLYETAFNVVLASLLFTLIRWNRLKGGQIGALYFILYGIIRFIDEFWRGDHASSSYWFGALTPAQVIGIFLIPLGLGLFLYLQKRVVPEYLNEETDQSSDS